MYTDFYGLSDRPFQLTPDARYWFESRTHKKAMAYLGYGLAQGEGFIVITGDVGAGKSTLVALSWRRSTASASLPSPGLIRSRATTCFSWPAQ